MLKQIIAIVLLSILVTLTMPYIQDGIQTMLSGHAWVSQLLMEVFAGGSTGSLIRSLISLLVIPIVIGLIPVTIFWLAKRKWFPYFMQLVWVVWLVQVAALVVLYKATT